MAKKFTTLSCNNVQDFIYGTAPNPVQCKNGMVIGGGIIYPEINFTLPAINIQESTMKDVIKHYKEMTTGVLTRAHELYAPGVCVEIELLPPMTIVPKWGIEVTKVVRDIMGEFEAQKGLKSIMRLTPNDTRETKRPPMMRSGELWDAMLETFAGGAKAGADLLSIESTGGKEAHDDALINADQAQVVFSLGVMGSRDMEYLWGHIVDIAQKNNSIAAGDTACGFANTAMVLAEKGMIPKVFAAVVRVVSASRSLVAYEMGAVGPSKDCAYEGPYIKAIAGIPLAMEGKVAACAHASAVGNISSAVADLWSNESVQNVRLLGNMAPTVSMEQLVYDCRLMNVAKQESKESALKLQKWLVESDSPYDPHAYIMRPDVVLKNSAEIVKETDHYRRAKVAAQVTVNTLREAIAAKKVQVANKEIRYIDIMQSQLDSMPDNEEACWAQLKPTLDLSKFIPSEYNLK